MYRSGVWWLKVPHLQPRSIKGPKNSPQQLSIIHLRRYRYLVAATIGTYEHHYQAVEITDMRLLNTTTHKVKEFVGSNHPPYVILSHTWEDEEVSLKDIENETAKSKKGFAKIAGCCRKAAEDGFEWVWIDTCCIDKTSSAELSEAINSMYHWYQSSTICYAYLQDVSTRLIESDGAKMRYRRIHATYDKFRSDNQSHTEHMKRWLDAEIESSLTVSGSNKVAVDSFGNCRWFTRGWTLQELLAPNIVEFYTEEWREIGTKESLAPQLSSATDIPVRILRGASLLSCSVAERLSWASTRQTTRVEDQAYCLLGLFGVNMPLLYGEGEKAFARLQEQILRQEEDYSILAWTLQYDCGKAMTGFLASSPSEFARILPQGLQLPTLVKEFRLLDTAADAWDSSKKPDYMQPYTFSNQIQIGESSSDFCQGEAYQVLFTKDYARLRIHDFHASDPTKIPREPPSVTSRGLHVSLPVLHPQTPGSPAIAWIYSYIDDNLLCVLIEPSSTASSRLLRRHSSSWLISVSKHLIDQFELTEMFLLPYRRSSREVRGGTIPSDLSWGRGRMVVQEKNNYTINVVSAYPTNRWNLDELFFRDNPRFIGCAMFECTYGPRSTSFTVQCGVISGRPWCSIDELSAEDTFEKISEGLSKLSAEDTLRFLMFSDRAATRSSRLPGTALSAAIRKGPNIKGGVSVYTLHIDSCTLNRCDYWVKSGVLARDRQNSM